MVKNTVSILRVTFLHKCPSCGKGSIYSSLLAVNDKCDNCGFALKEHDAGDGPAFFAMFISGILLTTLAVLVDVRFVVPLWLHVVIWIPVIIILSVALLRIFKSFLIGVQYRNNVLGFRKGDKK